MKKISVFLSALLAAGVVLLSGCNNVETANSIGITSGNSENSVDLPSVSVSESSLNSSEPESSSGNSDYEASSSSGSEAVSLPISSGSEASSSEPESSSSVSSSAVSSSSSKPASSSSTSSSAVSSSSSKPASSSSTSSSAVSSSSTKPASSSSSVPSQKVDCENGVHALVVAKGVVPTCAKQGLTPEIRCSECGAVFTNQTTLSRVHCFFPTGISGGVVNYTCNGGCGYPYSCTYNAGLSEKSVYNTLITMKAKYPEGTPFDNSNSYFTDTAFPFVNYTGRGCAGFALELSDAAFGEYPTRYHFNFDKIRVGDIVRILDDQHSVIVLEVNGREITVAEANYNRSVHWGRKLNLDDATVGWSYVLTRYPD